MLMCLRKAYNKTSAVANQAITGKTSAVVIILTSTFSVFIFYKIFFYFSKIIWSMNLNVELSALSPQIRSWVVPGQRDGVETYVLYALVFVCIFLTALLVWLWNSLGNLHKKVLSILLFIFLIINAYFFYLKIGFYPPMPAQATGLTPFVLMAVVMFILWLLLKMASLKERIASIFVVIFLLPICFIATSAMSTADYSYIFAPALRILKHFYLKDIYFQYDLLLSGIAAIWMKLNINLNYFQVIGQFSFYALFLASFFFSKKFFIRKQLAYYLLISLVLVKIYGLMSDPIVFFQVTPLRLDWWLLILIISFSRGFYDKLLGIVLGLLIIFHHTFGLIYLISYLEIISVLFLFDLISTKISFESFKISIKRHFLLCLPNIVILILSFIAGLLILGGNSMGAASDYQKIGIGFMAISPVSFYWYFIVLVGATVAILIKNRKLLSINYFNSSLLLVALSIGNSIYFFGRSHEHNIINISASLIFVLFLFFDLVFYRIGIKAQLQSRCKKIIMISLPSLFIVLIIFYYSAGILNKTKIQLENIQNKQFIYPMTINSDSLNIKKVRELTNNSDKVYFIGTNDFYYYYYGNYTPIGYFSPYTSWVYKSDMIHFMQDLLDKEYYIVSPISAGDEMLLGLKYNKSVVQDGFKVVWNIK